MVLGEVFEANEIIPYDLIMRNELPAKIPKTVTFGTKQKIHLS